MGGVFGHMSHIYDNPYMTFGQIKDVMNKASAGELQGTEKTDGQNLFVSYNVKDGTVRAARNKGNIKAGGMTPAELLAKFEGRGALTDAFVNSFYAFEEAVESFSDEELLELFGPDTNIYYNAEVMDPGSANVINYDKKTFLIHRAGHAAYDRETGKPIPGKSGKDFGERQAAKLQAALERTQDKMSKRDFKVEVNAIRNLEGLGNDEDLKIALGRLDQFMSSVGVNNNDNIGTYIVKSLDKLISEQIPELNRDAKKLLIKRIMEDYYGVIEGEAGPKKVRGLETRQILKVADDPEVNDRVKHLASKYPQYLKKIIFPIEDIIHDFAVEMLRSLKSAFILDSDEELERQRAEVDKAIKAIEASGNEEAMEILKVQMEKLKNIEGVSSAAEGFVFDYDGNTYKFTGGFAPMNQILGLFKYGRKGIPALAEAVNWALNEQEGERIAAVAGGFKPPHKGHMEMISHYADLADKVKLFIGASPRGIKGDPQGRQVSAAQSLAIWAMYLEDAGLEDKVVVEIIQGSPMKASYSVLEDAVPGQTILMGCGAKDTYFTPEALAKYAPEGVDAEPAPCPTILNPNTRQPYSATAVRATIRDNDLEAFKDFLPKASLHRAEEIFGLLGGGIQEISAMAVGSAGGHTNSNLRRRRRNEDVQNDEIVTEVMNYLLGISVG